MKHIINSYLGTLSNTIANLNASEIETVAGLLRQARDSGRQIFIFGNGGSASTASHFACDMNKGASASGAKRFKVICLNDSIPTMLAYSNDVGFEHVFKEQLENFCNKGDLVVAISGSGNSRNVISAIALARERGCITVGITGYNGGKLREVADYSVNANVDDMQLSEDIHMIWVHVTLKCLI